MVVIKAADQARLARNAMTRSINVGGKAEPANERIIDKAAVMGIFRNFLERQAANKFLRSPLGQALHKQTQEYFYTTSILRHLSEEKKQEIISDFTGRIAGLFQTQNPFLTMREELAAAVLGYAQIQVLCLKEVERANTFYGHSPYITGKLHYRIRDCSPHNEELKYFLWQCPETTDEERM